MKIYRKEIFMILFFNLRRRKVLKLKILNVDIFEVRVVVQNESTLLVQSFGCYGYFII